MLDPLILKKLTSPWKVQEFINNLEYNQGSRLCPTSVLKMRRADCLEAAVFACAILTQQRKNAFLIDLRAVRDDDHILCVFEENGKFGAIAQSKFLGLRYRHPVYAHIRELVLSYFHHYFNYFGEYSLREYSIPFSLRTRKDDWLTDDAIMHKIEEEIDEIPHHPVHDTMPKLPRVSYEQFWADVKIIPKGQRIGKIYQKR
jgi:hypothetical protein